MQPSRSSPRLSTAPPQLQIQSLHHVVSTKYKVISLAVTTFPTILCCLLLTVAQACTLSYTVYPGLSGHRWLSCPMSVFFDDTHASWYKSNVDYCLYTATSFLKKKTWNVKSRRWAVFSFLSAWSFTASGNASILRSTVQKLCIGGWFNYKFLGIAT